MKRALFFAVTCVAVIAVVWWLAEVLFPNDAGRQALGTAAAVAFVAQMVAFLVARGFARRKNVMAGWGIGIALRFVVLLLFGLVAVPKLGLPLGTSLLALATFLFVSTLIEPLFLKS
jgi:hypothetical protein